MARDETPRTRIWRLAVIATLAALMPTGALSTDSAAADSSTGLEVLTPTQVENTALFGMVWGFLKYHHRAVASGAFDWDGEFLGLLPDVLAANDCTAFRHVLTEWVERIGVPEVCLRCAEPPIDVQLAADIGWIGDGGLIGEDLSLQLETIYASRSSHRSQAYVWKAFGTGTPMFSQEPEYLDCPPLDAGVRILALVRLWNALQYWFPYRDQMDSDWKDVLHEMLPSFAAASDWDDYRLALMELLARVGDTHANLWSERDVLPPQGEYVWPVKLRFVEGELIVVGYEDSEIGPDCGLQVGDLIRSIDGRSVADLVEDRSVFYGASNEAARRRDIARYFVRGTCGTSEVAIERGGDVMTLDAKRSPGGVPRTFSNDRPGEAFQLLSPEVAYLKLSSIRARDIPEYLERAEGTLGWIIDIRGYPSEFVVFDLGGRFISEPTVFARITEMNMANPGVFTWEQEVILEPISPGYAGKVAILVDETTQSQAEYTAMALRVSRQAVVVGSTTAGADGNITTIALPGGFDATFTGVGVFNPDRTPTQRVGVLPDIVIEPTVAGLRSGRDEILEAAIRAILGDDADEGAIRDMTAQD